MANKTGSEQEAEGTSLFLLYIGVLVFLLLLGFIYFVCQPK
jgi:hypothetical protein